MARLINRVTSIIKKTVKPSNNSLTVIPFTERSIFQAKELGDWYHPVLIGPMVLAEKATHPDCLRHAIQILERLEEDDYLRYLFAYYQTALERFGDAWRYADIVSALLASAQLIHPESYLEIGVRRGRSMAMVAATCPECSIWGFDLWIEDYAGMPNPGPDYVESEMKNIGYRGKLRLISGNSHVTIPGFFNEQPDVYFDLITVDGDHSELGAEQDLRTVIPRLKVGGVLVFDDISHPLHPYLGAVWDRVVGKDSRFTSWKYNELGYGVAVAIRKDP